MEYRRLGPTGLRVSALGLGSWVTFANQLDRQSAAECMSVAFEAGVNFFDNAESYAGGNAERVMGAAIADLGWKRSDYVITTKYFWGIDGGVNSKDTLNRKYLLGAIDPSLERFGLDFVDIVYCHRPDPETPVLETVWAMHDIISSGRALYWGTSEWPATAIEEALAAAEKHHLHAPVVEQPQYNLLTRERVEDDYRQLYESPGLGLTVWSPLASGVLSGKYIDGIPADSRLGRPGYAWLRGQAEDTAVREKVVALVGIARELGCTPAQLAIAWCTKNADVSSVITGASNAGQVRENVASLEVADALTPEVMGRIEEVTR
jgi:voltage-dependent potassium channel beta subunit